MDKYQEFLRITKHLNKTLNIIPVLYGSLGLSQLTKTDLKPEDTDILVPQKYITTNWFQLKKEFAKIGYELIDEKEHEFIRADNKIGISFEEDLLQFADIDRKNLKIISENGIKYKVLDLSQYLKVYEASKKDSYRSNKNNKKDFKKIELIKSELKQ